MNGHTNGNNKVLLGMIQGLLDGFSLSCPCPGMSLRGLEFRAWALGLRA